MNKVELVGRLTRDMDIRYTQSKDGQMCVARGTLAVDRRFTRDNDEQKADFISVVAFGKLAEFFEKYGRQGTKFAITGRIQTGSYTNKDGVKVYTTDVVIQETEFAESKNSGSAGNAAAAPTHTPTPAPEAEYMNVPDTFDEEELPFN
jgi:single-strand DNA-binding protein